MVQMAYILRH